MEDKRFDLIAKDPKFRRVPKTHTKVKIDKRFQSMFQDKKFQLKYTTDKRGRPVQLHSNDDLKRYYDVSSQDEDESEDEVTNEEQTEEGSKALQATDKALSDNVKIKLKDLSIDYARGERTLQSESSSDDEETDDEVSESEEIDHKWGELDADAGQTDEATYRLAVCNLDWDRIRAVDLMVLFSSFLPSGGIIKSVTIYPSEFGKQRLQEEEVKGPIELVEAKKQNPEQTVDDDGEGNEEGSRYHMEKLRQYQLNRLKYYYAVVTFDSVQSANKIYTECDGMEYESSATKIDLRFIPDDMTFDDEPKESCDKLPNKYEPRFFTTTALQQAKVELTWDETNPDRLEFADKVNSGKISEITEQDLQNYLAGSDSDESDRECSSDSQSDGDSSQSGNPIDKYKALLQDIQEKEKEKHSKDVGLEISWGIDLKEKTDKLMQDKLTGQDEKTPFEKYLEKRKEKRKERKKKSKKDESEDSDIPSDIDMNDPYFAEEFDKPEFKNKKKSSKNKKQVESEEEVDQQNQAELDLLLMNEDEDDKKHFNFKKIQEEESEDKTKKKRKKKGKKGKGQEETVKPENEFKVNVEDKRFSAIFTSHHYNIDPTDPHYKKTKGMDTLIQEKFKRRGAEDDAVPESKKPKTTEQSKKRKDVDLKLLVKNVKRKTQEMNKRKK